MLVVPSMKLWLPMEGNANDASAYTISGLVSHWKMNDDAVNTTVLDSYGANNGTAQQNTSVLSVAGKINDALSFNGSSDYISVPITYNDATEWSLSIWARKEAFNQYQGLYADYTSTNKNIICGYEIQENRMSFYAGSGSSKQFVYANNVWTQDEWIHWTFVFKGSTYMRIYKNGEEVAEETTDVPASIAATHETRMIGRYSSYEFQGKIDDVRIYNRALNQREISRLYNKGEGTEDITDNDGTIYGAVFVTGKFGKALSFDGTDDYISVGDTSTFKWLHGAEDTASFKWYIAFWVKLTNPNSNTGAAFLDTCGWTTANAGIFLGFDDRDSQTADRELRLFIPHGVAGEFVIDLRSADNVYPNDTDWHFLEYSWDQSLGSNNGKIYVDLSLVAQGTKEAYTPSTDNSGYPLNFGRVGSDAAYLNGAMDEPMILDKIPSLSNRKRIRLLMHPLNG